MGVASTMWKLFEPIHSITYFERRSLDTFVAAGIRGFWRGYFAGRSAPLGPVGAAPIVAAYYNFSPQMVGRALPSVWSLAGPEEVLRARSEGAVAALTGLVPDVPVARIEEAAELLETAAAAAEPAGRVLGAANQALPRPSDPYARLFQVATTLREHRGDGHVAALVAADLGPVEVLVLRCGRGDLRRDVMQSVRGWTDEEWAAGQASLVERGLLAADGTPTDDGNARFMGAEAATNAAAEHPWTALGPDGVERARELLTPIAVACRTVVPEINPIGLPAS
jgi:helix-turn-helix protein